MLYLPTGLKVVSGVELTVESEYKCLTKNRLESSLKICPQITFQLRSKNENSLSCHLCGMNIHERT